MDKVLLSIKDLNILDEQLGKLQHASFYITKGKVTGLLGLDNSGRELLIQIFLGKVEIDWEENNIYFDGERVHSYQEIKKYIYYFHSSEYALPNWKVSEYISLSAAGFFLGKKTMNRLNEETEKLFRKSGVVFDANKKMSELNEVERRMVEIIKARQRGIKLLIIEDECEGMDQEGVNRYASFLQNAVNEKMAVVVLSHSERVYTTLSDNYIILRKGRVVKKWRKKGNENKDLVLDNYLLGNTLIRKKKDLDNYGRHRLIEDNLTYEVLGVELNNRLYDLEFRRGEITTIEILDNMERKRFFLSLSGRKPEPQVYYVMQGQTFQEPRFSEFIKHKIVSVMKLKDNGEIFGEMSIGDNLLLPSLQKLRLSTYFFSSKNLKKSLCEDVKEELFEEAELVKYMDSNRKTSIALERWYIFNPNAIVLYDPFTSSDAYGVSVILSYIKKIADRGAAVIVVQSTIEYMEGISDQVFNFN